jgi:opacity protein-like surface antigen
LGVRFGTTIDGGNVIWQPFGAVSVWHEFGPNTTSNYVTCTVCVVQGSTASPPISPLTISAASSTTTFGTYGQYSLGISAALAGTGWLGFARVDYREGPNLEGLSGTGGIRYQFTPDNAPNRDTLIKTKAAPSFVQAVNWTGFYIGGFGGATQGTADWGYGIGEVSPHVGGYLFGGDIGYNYQIGSYVVGAEADVAKTNSAGGTACGPLGGPTPAALPPAPTPFPMFQMTCDASANWIGTATARVGYAWERILIYAKAGGAWTDERFSATCAPSPVQVCTNPADSPSNGFTASTNRGGWVAGWGTEFAFSQHWSAKAEADYISFGDTNVTASDGSLLKVGMHIWEEKLGVNYRF